MSDVISREAAIEAALRVRDVAKTLNLLEMAAGAAKCADDLHALPAAPAVKVKVKVKVKPLVWETHPYGLVAGASWGDAYIINTRGKGIVVINGLPFNPEFHTLEAAKAAAQADYEARILAALEGGEA